MDKLPTVKTPLEKAVKEQVKKILKEYDAYHFMPVSNGMGAPALDFIVCHKGRYLSIETKRLGLRATARQMNTMVKIAKAGGKAMVFDGSDAHIMELIQWLTPE